MTGNRRDRRSAEAEAWHAWYGTQRWKRRRARQLAEHPLCASCLQDGRVVAASVADHLERHAGDYQAFWFGPLQSLCASCHSGRKQQAERVGYHYGCDVNGHPLDPNHPWNRGG